MINKCNLSKDHCRGRRRYKANNKTPEMGGSPQNERKRVRRETEKHGYSVQHQC